MAIMTRLREASHYNYVSSAMSEAKTTVKQHFIKRAKKYDLEAEAVIIENNLFQAAIVDTIPFDKSSPIQMIDYGCGTGITLKEVLSLWKKSSAIGVDFSPNMIDVCGKRLSRFGNRVDLQECDISNFQHEKKVDLIISSFTIHNLPQSEQLKVFKGIGRSLTDGGVFICSDFIKFEDKALAKLSQDKYLKFVNHNLSGNKLDEWLAHVKQDTPTTFSQHQHALRSVGEFKFDLVRLTNNQILYKATKTRNRQ